jgi:hypothetical protein
MSTIIPNHIPAEGWKGGFIEKHPELQYKEGIADVSTLEFNENLKNIENITRQQRVLWPEFTWETEKGAKDPNRCFQMFAPNISRMGYDDSGQSWSVICPQQGAFIPGIGTLNVEVTVTGQKGWVDETSNTQAIDMVVKPKIWFSPSAHQSVIGKLLWSVFELNHLGFHFPSEKDKAIRLNTYRTTQEKTHTISIRDGLYLEGDIPSFTDHRAVSWNHANVEVEIGEIVIEKGAHAMVTEFNELIMKAFNAFSGNMLQKGNVLAWNVWFDAPGKVEQEEWRNHAAVWRRSIDVDHCSPDGEGSIAKFASGKPFIPAKELENKIIEEMKAFVKKHI